MMLLFARIDQLAVEGGVVEAVKVSRCRFAVCDSLLTVPTVGQRISRGWPPTANTVGVFQMFPPSTASSVKLPAGLTL